jgi:hypothetical protein
MTRSNKTSSFRLRCDDPWKNDLFEFSRQNGFDAADTVRLATRWLIDAAAKDPTLLRQIYVQTAH